MNSWKMKTGMTNGNKGDRELTLVLTQYSPDNLPIARHIVSIPENADKAYVATIFSQLAQDIAK